MDPYDSLSKNLIFFCPSTYMTIGPLIMLYVNYISVGKNAPTTVSKYHKIQLEMA